MEDVEQIAADDWTDQDLLTRDEAGERLEEEILVVDAELATLRKLADPGPNIESEIELKTRRLDAMREAQAELGS